MSDRQILADQCGWWRISGEVAEHFFLRAGNLGVGPVITDAVAQAVLQVIVESRPARVIIFGPVPRLGLHARDGDVAEAGDRAGLDPFALDRVQRPERLAQRKGHAGADLQDREVIPHQRRERGPVSDSRSNGLRRSGHCSSRSSGSARAPSPARSRRPCDDRIRRPAGQRRRSRGARRRRGRPAAKIAR